MLWAAKECATANFGDARLTQRLASLVAKLTEHPQSTLPEALGGWSATKAAYRFLSNHKVTVEAIYDSHREATLDKIQDQSIILAVQDTTIFNFTFGTPMAANGAPRIPNRRTNAINIPRRRCRHLVCGFLILLNTSSPPCLFDGLTLYEDIVIPSLPCTQ